MSRTFIALCYFCFTVFICFHFLAAVRWYRQKYVLSSSFFRVLSHIWIAVESLFSHLVQSILIHPSTIISASASPCSIALRFLANALVSTSLIHPSMIKLSVSRTLFHCFETPHHCCCIIFIHALSILTQHEYCTYWHCSELRKSSRFISNFISRLLKYSSICGKLFICASI